MQHVYAWIVTQFVITNDIILVWWRRYTSLLFLSDNHLLLLLIIFHLQGCIRLATRRLDQLSWSQSSWLQRWSAPRLCYVLTAVQMKVWEAWEESLLKHQSSIYVWEKLPALKGYFRSCCFQLRFLPCVFYLGNNDVALVPMLLIDWNC